jgi:hypothetical protein
VTFLATPMSFRYDVEITASLLFRFCFFEEETKKRGRSTERERERERKREREFSAPYYLLGFFCTITLTFLTTPMSNDINTIFFPFKRKKKVEVYIQETNLSASYLLPLGSF